MSWSGPIGAMGMPGDRRERPRQRLLRLIWNSRWNARRRYEDPPQPFPWWALLLNPYLRTKDKA